FHSLILRIQPDTSLLSQNRSEVSGMGFTDDCAYILLIRTPCTSASRKSSPGVETSMFKEGFQYQFSQYLNSASLTLLIMLTASVIGEAQQAKAVTNETPVQEVRSAESYVAEGNRLTVDGRLSEAIRAYQEAVLLKPNEATALGNLGFAYCQLGQFEEA